MEVSFVIPVYNSTQSIGELCERIGRVCGELSVSFEIIFVNDGSPKTEVWPNLQQVAQQYPFVVAINLMRNFGKAGAVMCGFSKARGKWVVMMDDDLQHRPEDFNKLWAQRQHDLVLGAFAQKKHSAFQIVTSKIKNWLDYRLLGKPKHIKNGAYKLIRAEVVRAIVAMNITHPYISGLLFYATKDIVNVNVAHDKRKHGRSGFTFKKSLEQFKNFIFNNSIFMLKLVSNLGLTVALVSVFIGIYFLIRKLVGGIGVPGWASLVFLVSFTNGIILFSLGLFGEYFFRLMNNVEKRPAFIVREEVRGLALTSSKRKDHD